MRHPLFLFIFFIGSCSSDNKKNNHIPVDPINRLEINQLTQKVINGFRIQDSSAVNKFIFNAALTKGLIRNTYFSTISKLPQNIDLKLLKEWEIKTENYEDKKSKKLNDSSLKMSLDIVPIATQNYLAVYSIASTFKDIRYLIYVYYVKDVDVWKMASIRVGYYEYKGKNAYDYFCLSRDSSRTTLESYLLMQISRYCANIV